jgi:hypothetical protein
MATREGYKDCGKKYRDAYKKLWLGTVTREDLYKAIKDAGGITCLADQWK